MYDPLGEALEALAWIFLFVVVFGGIIALLFVGADRDQKHDDKMRQDFSNCQKDHKEWVLTGKNGLDGICVSKK